MLYVLPLQDLLLLSLRTAGFNLLTVVGSCWGHCKSVLDLATSPFTSWARSSDHFLCAGGRIHCFVAVSFALAVRYRNNVLTRVCECIGTGDMARESRDGTSTYGLLSRRGSMYK